MGEDEVLQASAIEKQLLESSDLFFLRESAPALGLTAALSHVFFFTDGRAFELQSQAVNFFRFLPEFARYRMKSQIEYQMTPSLPEFDYINFKILAFLRRSSIRVWYIEAGRVLRDSFNSGASKEVDVFRSEKGAVFPLIGRSQRDVAVFAQNLFLNIVDCFFDGKKLEGPLKNLNKGTFALFDHSLSSSTGSDSSRSNACAAPAFQKNLPLFIDSNEKEKDQTLLKNYMSNLSQPPNLKEKQPTQSKQENPKRNQDPRNNYVPAFENSPQQKKFDPSSNNRTKINIKSMNFNIQNQYENNFRNSHYTQNDYHFEIPSPASQKSDEFHPHNQSQMNQSSNIPSGSSKLLNTLGFNQQKAFNQPYMHKNQESHNKEKSFPDRYNAHFEEKFFRNQPPIVLEEPNYGHGPPHQKQKKREEPNSNFHPSKKPNLDLSGQILKGQIKSFDEEKGFGFIEVLTHEYYKTEVFVYRTQLEEAGLSTGFLRSIKKGNLIPLFFEVKYYESKKYGLCKKAVNLRIASN